MDRAIRIDDADEAANVTHRMTRNQIAWWLWAGGTVLIVLTWMEVVSPTVGWLGFGIGLIGSVLSWGVRPPRGDAPPETPKVEEKE